MLTAGNAQLTIARETMAIASPQRRARCRAHSEGGLLLGDPTIRKSLASPPNPSTRKGRPCSSPYRVGKSARVTVTLTPNQADFVVRPSEPQAVLMRFAAAKPGFGLGDHAVTGRDTFDTDITGYRNDKFLSGTGLTRMVSNFAIYPKQKFAFLIWDPGVKIVRSTDTECTQGARRVESEVRFTIFTGTPREIYRQFLQSRNQFGYPVLKPKYEYFGVGWEAFGALAWDTNQQTVKDNVDRYLASGYPLAWMVVGSGFWPRAEERLHETTSFGLYDKPLSRSRGLHRLLPLEGVEVLPGPQNHLHHRRPVQCGGAEEPVLRGRDGRPKSSPSAGQRAPSISSIGQATGRYLVFRPRPQVDGLRRDVQRGRLRLRQVHLGDDKLTPSTTP